MKNDKNGRRGFIKNSVLALSLTALDRNFLLAYEDDVMGDKILKKLSNINDAKIEFLLVSQISDTSSRWYGGLKDIYEVPHAHATMNFVIKLFSAYASKFSEFYLSDRLLKAITKAMRCLVEVQHEDGTIDLHSTNFHSTPDTAFFVNYLSPVYIALKNLKRPQLANLISYFEIFFKKKPPNVFRLAERIQPTIDGFLSALARINSFFPPLHS